MFRIAVASGKGGTGKTTIAVNLAAALAESGARVSFMDCDVEEPNAHIFLHPAISDVREVKAVLPVVSEDKCSACGNCQSACAFSAIAVLGGLARVFPENCHHCGACRIACPDGAITDAPVVLGSVRRGTCLEGRVPYIDGESIVGQTETAPLIAAENEAADCTASETLIMDAPPGTSCLMVETVAGADYCILVAEPTPFGRHDLEMAVDTVEGLGVAHGVVVNRSDVGTDTVEELCRRRGIEVLLRVEHDREIARRYAAGELLLSAVPGLQGSLLNAYRRLRGTTC